MKGFTAIGVLSSILLVSVPARGQRDQTRVEQQARALQRKAVEDDYLSTEFSKAEDKLNKAVSLCGSDKCSAPLRAQLRRDLGVVQIGGQLDREKGISNFVEALRIDPTIALDPDLKTKELEQALDQAKTKAGMAPARSSPAPTPAPTPPPAPPPSDASAVDPADCPPGFPCEKKPDPSFAPQEPSGKFPRFWIGGGLGFDFLALPAADDVCKLNGFTPKNDAGYYCATPDGTDYPSRDDRNTENSKLIDGKAGQVASGIAPANFRIWLSFDYALSANFLVGARLGLVFRTFPGGEPQKDGRVMLAPFHMEARLTYLIGRDAILRPVAPYVFLATGASQYDARVEVPVLTSGEPGPKTVHAWEIGGPWFTSLGAGIRVAFGDRKNMALLLGVRGSLTMPVAKSPVVPSFGPEANFQVGF